MSRTLNQKIKGKAPCVNCYKSQDGNWRNDDPTKRCWCERGQLLAVADRKRAAKQRGETELGVLPFPGGKAA